MTGDDLMKPTALWRVSLIFITLMAVFSATAADDSEWQVTFRDDFDTFNPDNWQDQILWVNGEEQCYVRDGAHNTREVSDGTLKLRLVNIGEDMPCDNIDKFGEKHPDTRYVAGRIASKNRQEFAVGKWTARLRTHGDGEAGMFPAWWLLGARNNEPPVQEEDENVCWPLPGSGEIDIWEHYGSGGSGHFAARMIKNLGHCDGGDWESAMKVIDADNNEWHEYSVEWANDDLLFRVDGEEVYRIPGGGAEIQEPLFAILNYALIAGGSMEGEWVMEVDWVKHEARK
ncbi:MAG: glycoside hydrolase family 16 protein [Gammaproteobacteria bacterium]|nr:glycoside hydrolase family 16 protein [Gammaproteobacteria bacterium]MBT8051575.1 glycoside hydrolase family 16 protein [Gammaproteobacteria bacterium]